MLAALRPGGILVRVATPPPEAEAQRHGVRSAYFIVEPDGGALAELARLAGSGRLRTIVAQMFPLAEAAAAFDTLAHRHVRGKVVLGVRP